MRTAKAGLWTGGGTAKGVHHGCADHQEGARQVPATIDDHRRSSGLTLFLGIVGGIAAFVGGFILLGDDRGTVDIGGMVSWQVSEIDPLWGYGLLIGGALALLGALVLALRHRG